MDTHQLVLIGDETMGEAALVTRLKDAAAADTEVLLDDGISAGGAYDGLGPWARDALTEPQPGVFEQTLPESCGAACGQIITRGARTEADLLATPGGQERTDPAGLARA